MFTLEVDVAGEAFAQTNVRFGHLDIIVTNPGIDGVWAPIEDLARVDQTLTVNLLGTYLMVHSAKLRMEKAGSSIHLSRLVHQRTFTTP